MIVIVESGSTKSDWRFISNDGSVQQVITAGFNPYHISTEKIMEELHANAVLRPLIPITSAVFFYGAGCSTPSMNEVVASALRQLFAQAEVTVDHDLMGAVLAASKGERSIVCILGTGSNACYFDGEKIDNGRSSLGYVLGDEAGGVWFGKRLIADHLHGMLPSDISAALNALGADKETVLHRVYREPRANTYLAGFMPVLNQFRTSDYAQVLLHEGMTAFLKRYVCTFPLHREVPVHFVGSVAHFFREELAACATQLGLQMGHVVQHPVNGLVDYHRSIMR